APRGACAPVIDHVDPSVISASGTSEPPDVASPPTAIQKPPASGGHETAPRVALTAPGGFRLDWIDHVAVAARAAPGVSGRASVTERARIRSRYGRMDASSESRDSMMPQR